MSKYPQFLFISRENFTAELSKSQTLVLIQISVKIGKINSRKNAFTGFCKENGIFLNGKIISRKNAFTVFEYSTKVP